MKLSLAARSCKAWRLIAAALGLASCHAFANAEAHRIVFRDDQMVFNGKVLELGQTLNAWDKVLPGKRRCEGAKVDICVWDSLGMVVVMGNAEHTRIRSAKIFLRLPDDLETYGPMMPRQAFKGQMELDALLLTSESVFSEIRRHARPDRNIRCGLRECVSPAGALGERTVFSFDLTRHKEHSTIDGVEIGNGDL